MKALCRHPGTLLAADESAQVVESISTKDLQAGADSVVLLAQGLT